VRAKRATDSRQPVCARSAPRGSEQRETSREQQGFKLHGIKSPKIYPRARGASRPLLALSRVSLGKHMSPPLLQVAGWLTDPCPL
jgi:hypothetical protein